MIKKLIVVSIIFLGWMVIGHAEEKVVLRVHPYQTYHMVHEKFAPLARYLSKQLDLPVEIEVSKSYDDHLEKIIAEEYDIAYMGPSLYVEAVEKQGELPLLARLQINGVPGYHGYIVVNEKSEIKTLRDLKGKRFAFGNRSSTMSHLVQRYMLMKAGVDVGDFSKYQHLRNHNNVAMAVLSGEFDAGAIKEEVFAEYQKRGLRILVTTPLISEHLFIASKKMETKLADKIRTVMLEMGNHSEGRVVLNRIKNGTTKLVGVHDSDYDELRKVYSFLKRKGIEF